MIDVLATFALTAVAFWIGYKSGVHDARAAFKKMLVDAAQHKDGGRP